VSIRVHQSYQSHLDFVGKDQADIAYVGPVSFIRIRDQYGPKPLLAKLEVKGEPFFRGMIIARDDSEIQTLADLAGKKFAFGDANSTMSHIVPRAMLARAGVSADQLGGHDFLHNHHNVALAVLGGYFDAGGVKDEVYYEFKKNGIKMLAQSPPIPEHLFLARADLPADLIARIRTHLLAIAHDPRKEAILSAIEPEVTGLLPAADQDYDSLRELMKFIAP
jgi:phosphonate transport system substrate-binding protein